MCLLCGKTTFISSNSKPVMEEGFDMISCKECYVGTCIEKMEKHDDLLTFYNRGPCFYLFGALLGIVLENLAVLTCPTKAKCSDNIFDED